MKRTIGCQVRSFVCAVVGGVCCPFVFAYAQEATEPVSEDTEVIDEVVIVVDRDGRPVDIDALRLEEAVRKIIQEFELEQTKQEEELWRLKLRSAIRRNTSRVAWGYDAQTDAARVRHSQASFLPIDRVQPATVVSIRF